MRTLDIICEGEVTPRIQLLVDFLEDIDVSLKIRRKVPAKPSTPFLLLPTVRGSRFTHSVPPGESVAIYLEDNTPLVPAHFQFAITNWPARSCDEQVRLLARYLKNPTANPFPSSEIGSSQLNASDQHHAHSRTKATAPAAQQQERFVVGGFALIALVFVGWLISSDSSEDIIPTDAADDLTPQVTTVTSGLDQASDENTPRNREQLEIYASSEQTAEVLDTPSSNSPYPLEQIFAQQALDHQFQCPLGKIEALTAQAPAQIRKLTSPLQAADANTITNKPADSWPPTSQ
ncbi:MAG: hypothetical protein AAF541_13260 [Pseudomonadota bacterium]